MKNSKRSAIVVVGGVIVLALLLIVSKYNQLVKGEENMEASWAQIDNQLQRRFDLIPNLLESTKGYMAHEEQIFTDIANARTEYGGASTVQEQAESSNELTSALNRLLVVVENYPDLKANEQFTQLMDELAGTENRLAVARQDYNQEVRSFNNNVRTFPGNVIAGGLGFEKQVYFEAIEGAETTPTVDFGASE